MKRWDQTTLALNVGEQIKNRYQSVATLVMPYLRKKGSKAAATGTEKIMQEIFEHVQQMHLMADIVVGAASSRYPLQGVMPWMLEGESAAIKHPFHEGFRREWLVAATIENLAQRLNQAANGLRAHYRSIPNDNEDVGLTRIGIGQWIGAVQVVSDAFDGLRSVLLGGDLDSVDWRELGLLKIIPEPTRTEILARLENRYDQEPTKALGALKSDLDCYEDAKKWAERFGKTLQDFCNEGVTRTDEEQLEKEWAQLDRAEVRIKRHISEAEALWIAAESKRIDEQLEAGEEDEPEPDPKPLTKSQLNARRIAEQRKAQLEAREEKKRRKKEEKAARDAAAKGAP